MPYGRKSNTACKLDFAPRTLYDSRRQTSRSPLEREPVVSNVPDELRYSKEHEYLKSGPGGVATIGITDYAQGELGDVVFVNLPKVGDKFAANGSFGVVEAVKAVSELYSPVGGEVVEVNAALDADPGLVNRDPYGAGWMIKVKVQNSAEVDALLTSSTYKAHIGE